MTDTPLQARGTPMQSINDVVTKKSRYFAVVAGSLEKYARQELLDCGVQILKEVPRGIHFTCSEQELYRILYSSRLVQRVLFPLLSFDCHSVKYLYQQARKNIDWLSLFSLKQSFGIDCNLSSSFTRHSLYASQVLKDAICDAFREQYQARPSYSNKSPDILFNLHIQNNYATIALDILGCSMHQRAYRVHSVEAPLQETLAAAIVQIADWQGEGVLCDPMCGSGTLIAEALMRFCNIPAGYLRDNSRIQHFPGFKADLWDEVQSTANAQIKELAPHKIYASDINPQAVEACRENISRLPGGGRVQIRQSSFQNLDIQQQRTIITNPPYGIRLEHNLGVQQVYHDLGDFLKQKCPDSTAYILCGNKDLVKDLRLRAHWTKSLKNGDMDTRLAKIIVHGKNSKDKTKIEPEGE